MSPASSSDPAPLVVAAALLAPGFPAALSLVVALAGGAGCTRASSIRARALPQLQIHARRGFSPSSFRVDAVASFPLSGRRADAASLAVPDPLVLADLLWVDQADLSLTAQSGYVGPLSAPTRSPRPRGGVDSLGDDAEDAGLGALPSDAVPCTRADTCAWARLRAARVMAAWGVTP